MAGRASGGAGGRSRDAGALAAVEARRAAREWYARSQDASGAEGRWTMDSPYLWNVNAIAPCAAQLAATR